VQLLDEDRATVLFETTEVIGFQLDGLTSIVSFHDPAYIANHHTFRIQRGIIVNGTPNFITSSQYYSSSDRYEKRVRTLEGHVFPTAHFSTPGDVTYHQIIDTVCAEYGLTPVFANPAAAWLNYAFYPAGRTFNLNSVKQFFTILRQKYLIFATDYDNDNLYFYQAIATSPSYPGGYNWIYPGLVSMPGVGSYKSFSFLSRDEASTTHISGDGDNPLHNLGYLHSTASHPARTSYYDTNDWIVKDVPPNLKFLDFDAFAVVISTTTIMLLTPAKCREIFNQKLHPSWQWQLRYLDVFGNTEGGSIPSTIEAAAPYTPINTSNFDKNFNSTVNNLQALADRVDELTCGPAFFAATGKDTPDSDDLLILVDSLTATHIVRKITVSEFLAAAGGIEGGGSSIPAIKRSWFLS
jgi:hypothetical protein